MSSHKNEAPVPRPDLNGLLVQQPGNAQVNLVFNGLACWIPNPTVLNRLFSPISITAMDLSEVARGETLSAGSVMIHNPGPDPVAFGEISLFTNGKRHWVPNMDVLHQYNFANWIDLPPEIFDAIPAGADVQPRAQIHAAV
jgi:hypothetical protein